MHPIDIHSIPAFSSETGGVFVPSCFTVFNRNTFTGLSQITRKFEDDLYSMDGFDHYDSTMWLHEERHFHDFIGSSFMGGLILWFAAKWKSVRQINTLLRERGLISPRPIWPTLDNITQILGQHVTLPLLEYKVTADYFFKPKRCKSQPVKEHKNTFISMVLEPFPSIPCWADSTVVMPIDLSAVLEGSAILSQLSFVASGAGPSEAKALWQFLETAALKEGKTEYVTCLRVLQNIFGREAIFNPEFMKAFRALFRFALDGILVELDKPRSEKEERNIIFNRFTSLVNYISETKTQKHFLDGYDKFISKFINENDLGTKDDLAAHIDFLQKFLNSQEFISSKTEFGLPEFVSIKTMYDYHLTGLKQDKNLVDNNLDFLFSADEESPALMEAPIRISGLDTGVLAMEIDGDDPSWMGLYIMDSLSTQCLSSDNIICPFSGINVGCGFSERSNAVDLLHCAGQCFTKEIADYIGLV